MSRRKKKTRQSSACAQDESKSLSPLMGGTPSAPRDVITLVELPDSDGVYLVFGDPHGLPCLSQETALFPQSANDEKLARLVEQSLSQAVGGANVGLQVAHGLQQASGLYRFGPETVALLRAGVSTVAKNGWNLGTLPIAGRFAHSVRWLPAATASATAIAASLGTALVLLAIQWQLGRIETLARETLEAVNTVLLEQRTKEWAEAKGVRQAILSTLDRARKLGAVTPAMWNEISGRHSELIGQRDIFLNRFKRHRDALSACSDTRRRHEWLGKESNAAHLLADIYSLIGCEQALFVYDCLKIGHLMDTVEQDPRNAKDANHVREIATISYRERMKEIEPLLGGMQRQLGLMAECHGKRWILTESAKISADAMQKHASHVLALVRDATRPIRAVPVLDAPVLDINPVGDKEVLSEATSVFSPDTVQQGIKRRLRWIVDVGETIKRTIAGRILAPSLWSTYRSAFLVLTDRRVFVLELNQFQRDCTPLLEKKIDNVTLEQIAPVPLLSWHSVNLRIDGEMYCFSGNIGSPEFIGKALASLNHDAQ